MKKCGHVALIGRPNAGKSTLLNRLLGQKISIVSDKPQTTRKRLLGVVTTGDMQVAFVDTPGVHKPGHGLNKRMMKDVYQAVADVDLILHLVDASERYGRGEEYVTEMMRQARQPVLLLLNKVDLINKGRLLPQIEAYSQRFDYKEIVPISAIKGSNLDRMMELVGTYLPARDFLYPEDYFTDQQERGMCGEIIREQVLKNTRQEIPYSTAVQIEEFDEARRSEGFVRITASIIVDKPGHKKIVIGRSGSLIKAIGTQARKDIQRLLDVRRIYLDLNVKVVPGWRDQAHLLSQLQPH